MKKLLSLLLALAMILALFAGCAAESGKTDSTKPSASAPEKASGEEPAKTEPSDGTDPAQPEPDTEPAQAGSSADADPAEPVSDAAPAEPEPDTEPTQPEPDTEPTQPEPDTEPAQPEPDTEPAQPEPSDEPDPAEVAGRYILQQLDGMDFIEALTAEAEACGQTLEEYMEEEGVSNPEELRPCLQLNADGTCNISDFEDVYFWSQRGSAVTIYDSTYDPNDETIDEPWMILAYLDGTLTGTDWDEWLHFVREDSSGLGEITIPLGHYDLRFLNDKDFVEFMLEESGSLEEMLEDLGVSSLEEAKELFALKLNDDGTGEYWEYSFTWTQMGSTLACRNDDGFLMVLAFADGFLIGTDYDNYLIFSK